MEFDQTESLRRRPARELPTFYYHTHFMEMLDFVAARYEHALTGEHLKFIRNFRALPKTAQCLYIRLVNRKGRVFARNRLRYPEIGPVSAPLADLQAAGLIAPPGVEHFEDLLGFLTRDELIAALSADFVGLARSLRKAEYVEFALDNADPATLVSRIAAGRLFVQRRASLIDYLLFLYFGRLPDGLAQFTMRDLGIVRTQAFTDAYEPRFNEREEAEEHFFFSRRLKQIEAAAGRPVLNALLTETSSWPEPVYPGAARLRDELAHRLGRAAERAGRKAEALDTYRKGESAECTERRVRLLFAEKRRDEAKELLERCLENPASDAEWLFASDIYERKFASKRTSAGTDMLRDAEVIELDESWVGAPERGAVAWYEERGQEAYRVENTLWRTMFGLLFWDELFDAGTAELHSPFEWLPPSLSDGTFYDRHAGAIECRLELLSDAAALKRELLKAGTRHYGKANGVFRWRRTTLDALFRMLDHLDTARLAAPLRQLSRAYNDARHGYPDLLVIDEDGARFVEIKAEGDLIRKNQQLRLDQLRAAGLRAGVVRVRWIVDPAQTYVVVDVETTGGKGAQHRVTEIGAVRVRGGRILDRFQTLLNPQRPIPGGITRLTGISQEMVADAPYFSDVADDFEEFVGDSIFVAHNVAFDYRFIAAEFARIGRTFRRPRLCTCATMRRLYPGHRSYSLAALCAAYDIPLNQHHRALCDAEAAAELLILINERRQARIEDAERIA